MSFFGKILVVLQMALSILFMMFAAAVYNTHINWREQANTQKKAAEKATVEKNNLAQETKTQLDQMKQTMDAAVLRAQEAEAQLSIMSQQFETAKTQSANLQSQLATVQRRSQNSAEEASARNDEARELREVNNVQTGMISEQERSKGLLQDEIRKLKSDLDIANGKNRGLMAQISGFTALLAKNGISPDEAVDLANSQEPPPVIEGKVRTVRRPVKLGSSETLGISLGVNDGLQKGHELTVWRPGSRTGGKPRYLAKIRIVSTAPDSAVGEVLEETRSGAIQEGDNVSTKL
ncbi:MAG: hypothetical protein ACK5TO_10965 [Planctomycetaceae bacterium]|jgi:hypothetical protein